jgi:hypothetical protein
MKWNQGVAFAHGERLSGAGVFVIRNPAGDEATYALGDRRDAGLAAAPILELPDEFIVKHHMN